MRIFTRAEPAEDLIRSEEPIREELFSVERLEQAAGELAAAHRISDKPQRGRKLLPRLEENARKLAEAYRSLVEAVRNERTISPAAEWLVDNFHIVEDQLREIREDLPRRYYYELPKLETGALSGFPRVYSIALTFIAHTDSRLEADSLRRFIIAYQRTTPLTTGELWAIAITLRLALVENLRRLATRIVTAREEREQADVLADKLLELAKRQPAQVVSSLVAGTGKNREPGRAFTVQLVGRLRDQDPEVMPALEWIESQLARSGANIDTVAQQEHARQAAAQVTVGNIITSMRLLSTLDWRDFFESVSLIDPILADDPAGSYAKMDFATRDRYRHIIERTAKRTSKSEQQIARLAIEQARAAATAHKDDASRSAHVGYYLIDDGLPQFEEICGYRPPLGEQARRFVLRYPTAVYLGAMALLIALVLVSLSYYALRVGIEPFMLVLLLCLALIPASDLALSLLNWSVTHLFKPYPLPKMDFTDGVPADARTMIVVPTLLTSTASARELCEKLEVHYLANRDEHFLFALLTDFADASTEEMPNDDSVLDAALNGIAELNARYIVKDSVPRFHLFHRRRKWNASEGKWIGWERKRGKLHEFNLLILRRASDTSFVVRTLDYKHLRRIKYLITLDTDTQLPREAARRLVGTIAHPLNLPYFDASAGRVTKGYGILQPRVSVSLPSAGRTSFARIFSGNTGIDPYTTAVSDAYQDLFREGSFTGKGLYVVEAFERALEGRVPENALLSHDLFEGLYARVALTSDIELLDDYPAFYDAYAKRQHRWTRGDWQIARWLFPRVPDAARRSLPNNLPLIARWKILDNLRRSLVAPALVLWFVAAWTVLPGSPIVWTLFAALALAFPIYAHLATSLLASPRGAMRTNYFWRVWSDTRANTAQVALTVTLLTHQASVMVDSICRTLYRKFVSHKRLLEWTTAAQAERAAGQDFGSYLRLMWPAPFIAVVMCALVIWLRPEAFAIAAAFLIAWIASPFVAQFISRESAIKRQALDARDARDARLIARRTWRFFESFVCSDDNWLPPDNFQEEPHAVVAHRTSPTNVGLLLLSTVAARDLGYLGTLEMIERLELTFATLKKLQRFRGHFLNWYDTRSLSPLTPEYVSTVDSGNLAGHLLAVKQACLEVIDSSLFDESARQGFADTLQLLRDETLRLEAHKQRTSAVTIKELRGEIERCAALFGESATIEDSTKYKNPERLSEWARLLDRMAERAAVIEDITDALAHEHGTGEFEELRFWTNSLINLIRSRRRDLRTLAAWGETFQAAHLAPLVEACSPEVAAQWRELTETLDHTPRLSAAPEKIFTQLEDLRSALSALPNLDCRALVGGLNLLSASIEESAQAALRLQGRITALVGACDTFVEEMDFTFLLDEERKTFAIGYNVRDARRDNSFYDLLASEARLASFVAIAKGDVPQEHWFRLGRALTPADGSRALISWTATMFEYLMPLLVMRNYDGTLLNQTYRAIVRRQIEYGDEQRVPWGISESAYNARDLHLNYQYGAFGVPGLGLKRGLSEDLVVSPYSTMLAALVEPRRAFENLRELERTGARGRYGFYEAIDYTRERLPANQTRALVRAYMAHHQGMSLVALDNLLNNDVMQERFHAEPLVQATELLLQERVPAGVATSRPRAEEIRAGRLAPLSLQPITRSYTAADLNLPTPRTQLLSNGTYSVMMTIAGSGYSMCAARSVTRWREDVTRDSWGNFCYLRDVRSGAVWSAGYQPIRRAPQAYEVVFAEDKVDILRRDAGMLTHTEVIVSPEDNAEVRRVSLTNEGARVREIELTSYSEVVLATLAADRAHPAFSNLFVETEFIPGENALIARRRPRAASDAPVWGVHTVVAEGESIGGVQYETDRGRFLGRGHNPAAPAAVIEDRPLSNTTGAVLDPVFSLRQRVRLQPGETARVTFATAFATSREEALMLADKYHDPGIFERGARLAWTKSQVEMRHLNIDAEEAHLFQRLAGRVLYSDSSLRPRPHVLALNTKTQSALWAYGISGDLPIVVVRVGAEQDLEMVRQILRGHEYLRLKGLAIDLVILNDHPPSYAQSLQDELLMLIRASGSHALLDKPGGVFLRRADIMPDADRILLHTIARVVIVTERGTLQEQLTRRPAEDELPAQFVPRAPSRTYPDPEVPTLELQFFNGLGGFRHGGREYVTILGEGQWTPAPWLNVVANEHDFGFQVTETGAGYTWSGNSRENRLTAWSNDPVSDSPSEVIYLRDEETGTVWTPTPLPVRESEPYTVRHGQGYTVFEHTSHGITQELLMFVPVDASVKISLLRLRNRTDRRRRLSVTSYNELVLGTSREQMSPFVITEIDEQTGMIFARNPYNNEFAERVMFAAINAGETARTTITCDRKEFLGRNGSLARPAAMRRARLSNEVGAGLDPCAAMQTVTELAPGQTCEIVILLGQSESIEEARRVSARFRQPAAVNRELERVLSFWDKLLDTVEVRTPDAAMNTIMNRWLPYQNLACRVWARSAFYQSGGAYGFRDQLQDVMAAVYAEPRIAREQIVRAAARQFKEGDVQHWWHPPTGRGVRTRFSDDLLWLPYVTNFYVSVTGDRTVLDEEAPFLDAPSLKEGEDETYLQPEVSTEMASVYVHCVRALERSLKTGEHGLPLMGSGDWNDGMNRVGHEGRGESVWVGWFLYTTLEGFAVFCDERGEEERAVAYRAHMEKLKIALEENAWDGDWYVRAFFDDGTPLGSAQNVECRIDSIAQSWGVISGAADAHRATRAMAAVEEYLIRRGDGLVILFTPPFDQSALDPGYIKGYVPGVRENGGQYTHAAIWTMIAYAHLGDGDRAGELFALLNPINHSSTRAGMHKYKVEPYVAAGDVYAVPPHTGRGGWTWYTGSSGWMYRAGLESILGFQLRGNKLALAPCIPRNWRSYEIIYRRGSAHYHIRVENPHGATGGVTSIEVDGEQQTENEITLADDGLAHKVVVHLSDKVTEMEEEELQSSL